MVAEGDVDALLSKCDPNDDDRLAELARRTRSIQQRYFRTRLHEAMLEAKELESKLDAMLARPEPKQEELFGDG